MLLAMATASSSSSNGQHHDHRAEDLLLDRLHLRLAAGEQRRRHVEARARCAPGDDRRRRLGAFVGAGGDVALDAVALRGRDDRPDDRVLVERVAHLQVAGASRRAASTSSSYVLRCTIARVGAVQIWPLWNAHTLPMRGDRGVDVGVVEHQRGALAAELEQQALHRRCRRPRRSAGADRGGAGERHHVDVARLGSARPPGSASADVTTLTTPGREADLAHDLGEHEDRRAGPAAPASSRPCSRPRARARSCPAMLVSGKLYGEMHATAPTGCRLTYAPMSAAGRERRGLHRLTAAAGCRASLRRVAGVALEALDRDRHLHPRADGRGRAGLGDDQRHEVGPALH